MSDLREEQISEVVDESVDDLNPEHIDRECERLGITVDELMKRITNELKARLM